MNRELFIKTELNKYYYNNVFVEFGTPIFFSCVDEYNTNYLCVASISDRQNESWLLVKASIKRISAVLNDKVTLYDAFHESEDGNVIIVSHNLENDLTRVEIVISSDVIDEMLPGKGEYLELNRTFDLGHEENTELDEQELITLAKRNLSITSDVHIKGKNVNTLKSVSAFLLGKILQSIISLRTAMIITSTKENARLSRKAIYSNDDLVMSFNPGSFGMRLFSKEMIVDPFSEQVYSYRKMYKLLQDEHPDIADNDKLKEYNNRIYKEYSNFLDLLSEAGYEYSITTAFPFEDNLNTVYLDRRGIENRRQSLLGRREEDSETLTMDGTLLGIDLWRKTFSYMADEVITGKIDTHIVNMALKQGTEYLVQSSGTIYMIKTVTKETNGSTKTDYCMTGYLKKTVE